MNWKRSLALTFIDKLILAAALIYVWFSVIPIEELTAYVLTDALTILLVVFISYLITIIAVNVLTFGVRVDGKYTKMAFGAVCSVFVLYIYPFVLRGLLVLAGLGVDTVIQNTLIWAMVIRTFVKIYLGRRWGDE